MDKTVLLNIVHTLEGQRQFNIRDKYVTVLYVVWSDCVFDLIGLILDHFL